MLYDLTSLLKPFMLPSQCIWHRGQRSLFNKVNRATSCSNEGHGGQVFELPQRDVWPGFCLLVHDWPDSSQIASMRMQGAGYHKAVEKAVTQTTSSSTPFQHVTQVDDECARDRLHMRPFALCVDLQPWLLICC